MLRIHIERQPSALLGFRHAMERERSLTARFRSVDFRDPSLRQTADPEREIETQRTCRDGLHRLMPPLTHPHDRTLTKGLLDLAKGHLKSTIALWAGGGTIGDCFHGGLCTAHW